MFSILKRDPLKEARTNAEHLLLHVRKVWSYRQDLFTQEEARSFDEARAKLTFLAKAACTKPIPDGGVKEKLDEAIGEMHELLCKLGGTVYPVRSPLDWVELVIVAVFVACGVRSFFGQPFKIPTSSMYPTYHGMTVEVHPLDSDGPSGLEALWRKLTLWTKRVEVRSPVAGEVWIPLSHSGMPVCIKNGKDSGLFGTGVMADPTDIYSIKLGDGTSIPVEVPKDFSFISLVLRTYFPEEDKLPIGMSDRWQRVLQKARLTGDLLHDHQRGGYVLRTHKMVPAGGRILHFDVLTGDMVLVDRMSYNFVRPKLGDPFVFETRNIPGLNSDGSHELYYIKRLAGLPGDTLRVDGSHLLRNGVLMTGASAFDKNNARAVHEEYYGYFPSAGDTKQPHSRPLYEDLKIPSGHFYALGDNSGNSADSRSWGFVPEASVVGRGFFILHPFTRRWGMAK
ncbi:MAG: signal peptidase I [Puniceicoccales bacterium]|jgi:signal peptidase I|nr:signal peptidase I [Puniceicoccales bacterium]